MAEDLDRLEEILREKIRQEPNEGLSFPKTLSFLQFVFRKAKWLLEDLRVFIERKDVTHIIHGVALGISLLIAICAYSVNSIIGIAFLLFAIIYHVISYPDSIDHFMNFFGYIILSFANRGSLVSISEPETTVRFLKSVQYILSIFVFGLLMVLMPTNAMTLGFEVISAITVSFGAVSYYYLSMAKSCWEDPVRKISEKDLFSWEFLVFLALFAGALTNLYPLVPQGFASVFGWFVVFLSYLFLSAVMAIPSLQAAIYITTRWRGIITEGLFRNLESVLG